MSNNALTVDDYILQAPSDLHEGLRAVRSLMREVAPDSVERTDYFQLPGYSYASYDYEGMFVWFSYKKSSVRLHVRPPVLESHKSETTGIKQTKSIIDFPVSKALPADLIKKLVIASIKVMKDKNND
jgi:uncharacterized protein YdhG (YjbR/CyaY superfamily)